MGRISRDPLITPVANLYQYAKNTPINRRDVLGLCCSSDQFQQLQQQLASDSYTYQNLHSTIPNDWWFPSSPYYKSAENLVIMWLQKLNVDSDALDRCADDPCPEPCPEQKSMCMADCIQHAIFKAVGIKVSFKGGEKIIGNLSDMAGEVAAKVGLAAEAFLLAKDLYDCGQQCDPPTPQSGDND